MGFFRRTVFNFWYFIRPPWDSGISPPELMEFIRNGQPGRALDLGCGTGTNIITLAKNGWQVTGVDFAPQAISIARRKVQAAGVTADLHVSDVTRLEGINGPFDFVLDLGCFHGLQGDEKARYLNQLQRVSAPHSMWLLYGFFKKTDMTRGPGLVSSDIEKILGAFDLVSRQEGVDRKERPSAYFLFRKK
jgi:ubiquinone/menaquinone biosynthesis C-methylase UbiE